MQIKNQIVNYFVVPPVQQGGMPRVFLSPVTMNGEVGKKIIEEQLKKRNESISIKNILHICFDLDSKQIYIPNASNFTKNQMNPLLKAAELKIIKDHGGSNGSLPIEGSPFSSIRIRKVSGFGYTLKSIKETFKGKEFVDLPVIEANLALMPSTVKILPPEYKDLSFMGGYIGKSFSNSIAFYDEKDLSGKDKKQKTNLTTQQTPFILINTSPQAETKSTEKEWIVLSGYRDYMYDNKGENESDRNESKENSFADFYAIKRHLYLGWPFEEVCHVLLASATNFIELINGINILSDIGESLEKEGYKNPSSSHYYITFKVDPKTFPLSIKSMSSDGKKIDTFKQLDNFRIIEYDQQNGFVLIETPAFISYEICRKILKAQNTPLITRYNPGVNKIDVKSPQGSFKEYKNERMQIAKISALVNNDLRRSFPENKDNIEYPSFRDDESSRGISLSNPDVCHIRNISEYFYAVDHIKKVCEKNNVEFKDVKVVVGPIERIFGHGVNGGFMDEKAFKQGKLKIPHELEKGLLVSPPIIAINSVNSPSYAEQTSTLIHEYCHNLFSITNPEHEHLYNKDPGLLKKDKLKWWQLYFDDEDERRAHIEQIKHELVAGRSIDEIVRDKVGGAITLENYQDNYPIALKFKELVMEAAKELEQENIENEKPTGRDTNIGRNDSPIA